MKKLTKMKLHNAVKLNEMQMKQVVGGDGDGTCGWHDSTCTGTCPNVTVPDPMHATRTVYKQE